MNLRTVSDRTGWKAFHRVPHAVYRDDPHWICPPESDVESIFSPASNKTFQQGEAALFYLLDDRDRPAGRVAAFIDHGRNAGQAAALGGIGFFESVDRADYAHALFDRAESWLRERGVQAVDGPVNFGERERYWGLLDRGFDPPLFQENYQPRYYKAFFEAEGYRPFEQILTFKGHVGNIPVEKFRRIGRASAKRYGLRAEFFDLKRTDLMAEQFCQVYNRAFADKEHFKPIGVEQMRDIFNEFKPIGDKYTTAMVYHGERPVGFCVLLPDINPFLRSARGKLNWLTLPLFMLRFRLARTKQLKGIAFGIDPDFQRRGVFPVMIDRLCNDMLFSGYPNYFLAGIRGHNRIMVDSILNLGVGVDRVHVAYRKVLDPSVPFEPHAFREV